jgi:hypothetical protein
MAQVNCKEIIYLLKSFFCLRQTNDYRLDFIEDECSSSSEFCAKYELMLKEKKLSQFDEIKEEIVCSCMKTLH